MLDVHIDKMNSIISTCVTRGDGARSRRKRRSRHVGASQVISAVDGSSSAGNQKAPALLGAIGQENSAPGQCEQHPRAAECRGRVAETSGVSDAQLVNEIVFDGLLTQPQQRTLLASPAGKQLRQRQKAYRMPARLVDQNGMMRYRASKLDCQA
jgi:nitrous oxidase accessory protein NosD